MSAFTIKINNVSAAEFSANDVWRILRGRLVCEVADKSNTRARKPVDPQTRPMFIGRFPSARQWAMAHPSDPLKFIRPRTEHIIIYPGLHTYAAATCCCVLIPRLSTRVYLFSFSIIIIIISSVRDFYCRFSSSYTATAVYHSRCTDRYRR